MFLAVIGWLGWKIFFPAKLADDDIPGWAAKEQLEVRDGTFEEGPSKELMILKVYFGGQVQKPADRAVWGSPKDFSRLPTAYHHRRGPLGVVLERFNWSQEPWTWGGP